MTQSPAPDPAESLYSKAEYLIELGRPRDALPFLHQILTIDPDCYEAFCTLASAHLLLKNVPAALGYVNRAVSLQPESEPAYRVRALILLDLGQKTEALQSAERAAALTPQDIASLYLLSKLEHENGLLDQSQATAEKIVSMAPELIHGYDRLSQVAFAQQRWADAEKYFLRTLEIDPNNAMALSSLGAVYFNWGYKQRALPLFVQAIQKDPLNTIAKENLKLFLPQSTLRELTNRCAATGVAKRIAMKEFLGARPARLDNGFLDFGNGHRYPIQWVGRQDDRQRSWRWAWAEPEGVVSPALVRGVEQVRAFGTQCHISELVTPEFLITPQIQGDLLSIISAAICNADDFYRVPDEAGTAFCLILDTPIHGQPIKDAATFVTILKETIRNFEVDQGPMLGSLMADYNLKGVKRSDTVLDVPVGGQTVQIEIGHDRIQKMEVV